MQQISRKTRFRSRHARGKPPSPLAILMTVNAEPARLERCRRAELREWIDVLSFALRRERNKSMMRHWSYDLNRHIALKSARNRLRAALRQREEEPGRIQKRAASIDATP